ncbi:MAG TPA: lipoate--protein ligase family protein [Bacillota bacterium]
MTARIDDQPWRLLVVDDRTPEDLTLSPVLAETVAEAVARGEQPPTVLLRWQHPYVLLGPIDTRLPRLEAGVAWLEARGLPVFARISGGSAVLLDDACLSFAVAVPCRDLTALRRNYEQLAAGVIEGLAALGVEAAFAEVAGTYCPGPYDLAVGGRKIAGLSQALRRGFAEVGGMILVSQPPERAVAILEGFYAAAGSPKRFAVDRLTNLEQLLGRPVSRREVAQAIAGAYARRLQLQPGELSVRERARARALLAARQLTSRREALP